MSLHKDGYTIIPNLLTPDETTALENGLWDFWSARGVTRNPSTWSKIHTYMPTKGMLFQHWGIGQAQCIWDVRQNPRVVDVFKGIYGTDNLTVSMDGASVGLKPEVTGRGWNHKQQPWLHLDQSPTRNGFECVQGWVTALPVEEGDATLTLLKGSHALHKKFAETFNLHIQPTDDAKTKHKKKQDWHKLTQDELQWYQDQCEQINVTCPAGSLVLWDSRTVHSGKGPDLHRPHPKNRMVAYVSYMPDTLTKRQRKTKQKAVLTGRMTTHWASERVRLFPKLPQARGNTLPPELPYVPPRLTPLGARLAGFHECPLIHEDPDTRKRLAEKFAQGLNKRKLHTR